jgi:DNA-directed RNA polymerase sigma subunit (sigma70/sigma32)
MATQQSISSKEAARNVEVNALSRNETDLELVKRAQAGDAEAFATLFHAHKARVYSICVRMTNNTAQAEDLTQDAFLQVFRKLSTFQGEFGPVDLALSHRGQYRADAFPETSFEAGFAG